MLTIDGLRMYAGCREINRRESDRIVELDFMLFQIGTGQILYMKVEATLQ